MSEILKTRALYVLTHHIQYFEPLLHLLGQADCLDLLVVYGTDKGKSRFRDEDFGAEIEWAMEMGTSYRHVVLDNNARHARLPSFRSLAKLVKLIDPKECDVVIVHGWGGRLYALTSLLAIARGVNLVYRTDAQLDYDPADFGRTGVIQGILNRLKPFLLPLIFKGVSSFFAIGSRNERFYIEHGVPKEKIALIPYTIDSRIFNGSRHEASELREARELLGLEEDRFRVIFSGKLIERKRPGDVIAAVSTMPSRDKVDIVFIGSGELEADLKSRAAQIGVSAHFLGFRNISELPLLYSLGDVIVLPSRTEPWGLVANEALSMGLPVLASEACGCASDLVIPGKTGYVFPAGDSEKLAHCLERLVRSPELLASMKRETVKIAKTYSLDRVAELFLLELCPSE